jgi:hypothetical protein
MEKRQERKQTEIMKTMGKWGKQTGKCASGAFHTAEGNNISAVGEKRIVQIKNKLPIEDCKFLKVQVKK